MTALRQRMLEDMQVRDLSPHTQRAYVQQVSRFARHFGRSPDALGPEEIRAYLVYLTNERKLPPSSICIAVSALRFLYSVTLQTAGRVNAVIPAPKMPKTLPVVLSPEEVVQFLDGVTQPHHRTILTTCYAAGLRISEAVRLTAPAIDSQRMVLRIALGKGQQDRYVMLSPKLLEILRAWWTRTRPTHWLFPGARPGHGSFPQHHRSKSRPTWLFATIEVWSRLWAGSVLGRRSSRNATAVLDDVILRGCLVGSPLIATDGFEHYFGVIVSLFGSACVYGQVLKTRRNDRVVRVERRVKIGSAYLRRRSPCHARGADQLRGHIDLLRCYYNFIRPHRALRFGRETRTPAMQAGLVSAPMNWSDISRRRRLSTHILVTVVRVPVAVQLMETPPAAPSTFSWPHEHRSAA